MKKKLVIRHKGGVPDITDLCGIEIPGLFKKDGKPGYEYIVGSNGVFRKVNNGIFVGFLKVEGIPSLPVIKSNISLTFKKIPAIILFQILRFMSMYEDEIYCQIYLNKGGKYFIYAPEQTISRLGNDYKCNLEMIKKHRLIAEFHSHPFASSQTNFSGIDDADESAGIIYGVVSGGFNIKLRIKYTGQEIDLALDDVFEGVAIPKEWSKRVKKEIPKFGGNYGGGLLKNRQGLGGIIYDKWGYPIDPNEVEKSDSEY